MFMCLLFYNQSYFLFEKSLFCDVQERNDLEGYGKISYGAKLVRSKEGKKKEKEVKVAQSKMGLFLIASHY